MHLLSGDNNRVRFHLWQNEIVLKREKVSKNSVQDFLKIFVLVFTTLKMHRNSKNYQFFSRKSKSFFKNSALLQLEWSLLLNSSLTIKCKLMLFEIYYIEVFDATELA